MADTGSADERLRAALDLWWRSPTTRTEAEVHAALVGARVFVAIAARSTGEQIDPDTGRRAESGAEMALLTLVGSAGGRAVPAFLDAGSAVGFRPGARPVALDGAGLCRAALEDGAVAVLLDPGGAALTLRGATLGSLAGSRVPIAGTSLSSRRTAQPPAETGDAPPVLLAALSAALATEPVAAARLLRGPDGLVLGVVPTRDLDPAGLATLAARVLPRLAGALPAEGLALAVVEPSGPGRDVPLASAPRRRWFRPAR